VSGFLLRRGESLLHQGGATLALQVGGQGLMLLAHVLIARAGGAAAYGTFAYTVAVVTLCLILAKVGQDTVALRFVAVYAQGGQGSQVRAVIRWGSLVALVGSILAGGVVAIWACIGYGDASARETLAIGLLALPFLAVGAVRANAMMGLGQVIAAQAPELIVRPLVLIIVPAAALAIGSGLSGYATVSLFALAAALSFITGLVLLHRSLRALPVGDYGLPARSEWLRTGAWMLLVTGAYQAYSQVDIAIVGSVLSKEEAGVYGAASKVAVLVQYALIALQTVIAPRISAAFATGDKALLQRLLSELARLATVFAIACGALLAIFATPVLEIFGAGFAAGSTVMRIVVLAHVVNAFTGATGFLLAMTGHQHRLALVISVMLGLHVCALLVVVPIYGIAGAAWVVVGATAATHAALAWMGWRILGFRTWFEPRLLRASGAFGPRA
jgi:O-antigen/teichoic acid export membrane protein